MKLKILVITDSVALPRITPEFTKYEDTWPELLRKAGHTVYQCSIGGATSSQLRSQCAYYNNECFDVDIVIIQCGIVDCAPRFLKRIEVEILKNIRYFGPFIIQTLNKNWFRKLRNVTYTPKKLFRENIKAINDSFVDSTVFFINIIPSTEDYEKRLKGITNNINVYNQILENSVNVIDIKNIEYFGVMKDHHHLNFNGHQYIFDMISRQISNIKNDK